MKSDDLLRLKALELKQLQYNGMSGDMLERVIEQNPGVQRKNVCAFVSEELFEQVDNLCTVLSLSKRQFVEAALVDMVAKSNAILAEVQPFGAEESV